MTVPSLFDETFLRRLERLSLICRRARAGQIKGERRSPKRGQSVEFADYRNYVPGDDFRQIDWNIYARLERFFLKLFVEEEDLTVHLLVDTSRSMHWGEPSKLRYALRAAGALGYIALVGLDRVTATSFDHGLGQVFLPHRGRQQAIALFDFLSGVQPGTTTDLAASLRHYAASASRVGPLLLLSDLFDPGWQEGLRALVARRFEVTVLHILAPDEVTPPLEGDLQLIDVETSEACEVTADYPTLRRYGESLAAWQRELRTFCGQRGINYAFVETSLPLDELLFALLRRRGVLK
jgi:uncharacterized protein (DUF58 family)